MRNIFKLELNPNRVYGLDILRALAILFVIVGHGRHLLPDKLEIFHQVIVFDGVSIFFVLSGFLIGGILIKMLNNRKASKNLLFEFWSRRWFRTLPNYFLVLTVLVLLNFLFGRGLSPGLVARYYVFSQNLFYPHPAFFPEAWSLSVEEWFYLLIPMFIFSLIIFLKIPSSRTIVYTALTVLILITMFRLIRFTQTEVMTIPEWDSIFRKQVFTRLDSLMYGMIGAYFHFYYKEQWVKHRFKFLWIGLILFFIYKILAIFHLYSIGGMYHSVFSFSLTSFATLCILPFLSSLKQGKGRAYKFFTIISLISYSMYLVNHSIVHSWILGNIDFNHLTSLVYLNYAIKYFSYWFFTITLSILIYKYFEVPMMNLRDNKRIKKLITT